MVETQTKIISYKIIFNFLIVLGKIMYNYFVSSWATALITICVWTSGCKLINTSKSPSDLISLEGWISDGFTLTCSFSSKILEISVGLIDP